jgi:hypothetical protein
MAWFERSLLAHESGGEPHAVQTLRVIWKRWFIAERLNCGCFSTAFLPTQTTTLVNPPLPTPERRCNQTAIFDNYFNLEQQILRDDFEKLFHRDLARLDGAQFTGQRAIVRRP